MKEGGEKIDTMLGARVYVNAFPGLKLGREEFQKLVLEALSSVREFVFLPDVCFHYTSYTRHLVGAKERDDVRIIVVLELLPVISRNKMKNGLKQEAAEAIKSAVLQRLCCKGIEITVRTPDSAHDGYSCWGMPEL